jgi:HIRAN domain
MPSEDSSSSSEGTHRLRVWLERGESGYWLRDAATGEALRWNDGRLRVVKLAGSSYRVDALQDDGFTPGRRLALVPEPENEHDPNAVAVWDAERRVQAGYLPAEIAPAVRGDEQAVSLWEFRDEEGRRIGLRVLIAPPDAWIQEPRA